MEQKNKNIFKDAKFGDKFNVLNHETGVTEIMLYTGTNGEGKNAEYMLIGKEWDCAIYIHNDNLKGMKAFGHDYVFEVISKYHEPVDENKLDELADNITWDTYLQSNHTDESYRDGLFDGFKVGYRKAIETYNKKPKIDEEKLDKLAADDALRARVLKDANYSIWYLVTETFKAGYRKAMEDFYGTEG